MTCFAAIVLIGSWRSRGNGMLRRGNGTRCVVSYCIAVSPGGKHAERSDAYSRSCELVHKVTRGLGSVDR